MFALRIAAQKRRSKDSSELVRHPLPLREKPKERDHGQLLKASEPLFLLTPSAPLPHHIALL